MEKIPITRLNKFFSDKDFDFEVQVSREYMEGDLNFTLVLYRVDKKSSETDDIYGESGKNEIRYFPPVEFKGIVQILEPENSGYNPDGLIQKLEPGNLLVKVHIQQLKELNIDINYGDYIGYAEKENKFKYYTVVNDGRVTSDNKHTIMGTKAYYRSIVCSPVNDEEFNGI